jgi:CBS domain-containing protein
MRPYSRGVRVQVYFGESDQVGHTPRYQAILEYLRKEGAAGATVERGVAGFGANSKIHTAAILRLSLDLPMVLTWIDAPGRVDRLLPGLKELAGSGIVTVEEVGIAAYGGRRLEQLRFDLQVRDAMTRPALSVGAGTSIRRAVDLLLRHRLRAVPVVDDEGRVVGILTNGDLVGRGGLGARLELLGAMSEEARRAMLDRVDADRTVREAMTPEPATIGDTETVATATHRMAEKRIKRLPVRDGAGHLVGILSRSDVLRAVGETFPHDADEDAGQPGAQTVGEVMRRDAPTVRVDADLGGLLDAVVSTRLNRAVVLDPQDHVLGVVTDADVIRSVDPASGVLGALMRTAGRPSGASVTAGQLVTQPAITIGPDATIAEAAQLMTESKRKILCIVGRDNELLGIVDRADLLRATGEALSEIASSWDDADD